MRAGILRVGAWLPSVTLANVALSAGLAEAAPRYTLEWEAPSGCPDAEAARASIDALLDEAPESGVPLHATVRITAFAGGHRLALRLSQAEGVREIEAPTCAELAETATVIVAIAIDPGVLTRAAAEAEVEPPEPVAIAPAPPAPAEPAIVAPLGTVDAPPPRPPLREAPGPFAIVSVLAGVDVGTLPRTSGRVGVWAGPAWRDATLELGGEYIVRRPVPSSSAPSVGILAQAWSVGARGCYSRVGRRVGFGLCGSVRAGAVHARGDGELTPRSARQPWVGLGPGVLLLVPVRPRFAVSLGLDVLYAAARGGFRTEPSGAVAKPWPVTFQGAMAIRWRSLTGPRRGGQPRR